MSFDRQPLDCHLLCSSSSQHLNQLYAGFGLLAQRGRVRLTASRATPYTPGVMTTTRLEVRLNGSLKLIYDVGDAAKFFEADLAASDLYFKRSYEPARVAAHPHGGKIVPLGLNYVVYGPGDFWPRRALWSLASAQPRDWRSLLREVVRSSGFLSRLFHASLGRYACQVANFEGQPALTQPARVLLLTQTWDPDHASDRPQADERRQMNQMRADCVRKLRQAHGPAFVGGLVPSAYALQHYPDCVVADPRQTRKLAYLRLEHQVSICVTTLGLHQSNGWRLGEYVAAARAIVTEQPCHHVPGNFEAGQNYLAFTTPAECVDATLALARDPARQRAMMERNAAYYQAHLRPDVLVWNTLQMAAARQNG